MAEVGVAIGTTAVGTIVTIFLQEAVNAFKNRKKKAGVTASAYSIDCNITRVKTIVPWYLRRHNDTSDAWRDMNAEWRGLERNIKDWIDKYKINIIEDQDFATKMKEFEEQSDVQSKKIAAHIQDNERNRSAQLQVQPDSPRNHNGLKLFGIEERLDDLWALVRENFDKQLQAAAGKDKVIKVISIVGSRGVGKTCLASQVYLDPRLHNSFQLRAFVSATGKHKGAVLEEVLQKLCSLLPVGGVDIRQQRAYLRSANLRCFIVVDDVHDLALGSAVVDEFRKKVNAIIILTTTVQKFAETWGRHDDDHVYKMMPLSTPLSRELFRAHCDGGDKPPKSEEFGVGSDDGIPLAVITWAEYRRDEKAGEKSGCKAVWSKFGDHDLGSRLEKMERVLKQSYDSLADDNLKTCLLYFSLFPPENSARRGSLVRRWEADGEVGCGMENWEKLVGRNVLCPIQVSINEGAKTCRLSGAMQGYILSHMSWMQEGFGRVCSGEEWPDHVLRRLSLHKDQAHELNDRTNVSCLRTLVVAPENKNGTKAPDLSLDQCRLLWVLDLEAYGGQFRVEQEYKKLQLLRYLSLRSASIQYIPQEIKELKELETLDVGKENGVRLHADVLLLPKLKHLVGKFKLVSRISRGAKVENLVTLAGFMTLDGNDFLSVIQRTKKLRKVKVFFDPKASAKSLSSRPLFSKKSYPLADAITKFLGHPAAHNRSLSLDIPKEAPTSVLDSLKNAKGKLYSLKLCGTSNFPKFNCQLKGIQKLCLSFDTLSWQDIIDVQKGLPVKYLKLVAKKEFYGVCAIHPQAGNTTKTTNVLFFEVNEFKNLEKMCLQSADATFPTIGIEDGALTKLNSLHLISNGIGEPAAVICKWTSSNQTIQPVNNQVADDIPPHIMVKEVALQTSLPLDDNIKKAWHQAARRHPKSPQVLFI